jgi:hypothetical protein
VSVMLPSDLAWVLNMLGFSWPNIDEDQLRAAAATDRRLAAQAEAARGHADAARQIITDRNSGNSVDAFSAHASKVSVNLDRLRQVYELTADALETMSALSASAVSLARKAVSDYVAGGS